jgi:hypothetical protein
MVLDERSRRWADVATKRDLDALEQRVDLRFAALDERLDHRFEAIDHRFRSLEERIDLRSEGLENKLLGAFRGELQTALTTQSRQLAIALAGTAAAVSALAFTAAGLT